MTAVLYDAKRSLISGHVVDTQYGLNFRVTEGMTEARKVGTVVQRSLSDATETLRYFGKRSWSLTLIVTTLAERQAMVEFLDSTEAQETFTFSPYGVVVASPLGLTGTTYNVRRVEGAYEWSRLDGTGATPDADAFRVGLQIEEA